MIAPLLKRVLPGSIWRRLRFLKGLPRAAMDCWWLAQARAALERRNRDNHDDDTRAKGMFLDMLDYQRYRAVPRSPSSALWITIDFSRIRNTLPNSGPLPVRQSFQSAREIVDAFPDPQTRRQDGDEFAGFALDDAVYDEAVEAWELWSSVRLAWFIATFAYAHYDVPTILELGCGPAHLLFFLRRYGLGNYLGIDGNPYLLKFNRQLRGLEAHFRVLNLQERIRLALTETPLTFDVVCSFEVLEHIREESVDNLLWTMRQHMHRRSVLFCTASLQDDMDVHVLVRPREWWLDRFARAGLFPRPDEAGLCRRLMADQPWNWGGRTNAFALECRG